ncbi:MAG: hypothetical protein ABF778_06695 [Liquorilactobacillus hordei]
MEKAGHKSLDNTIVNKDNIDAGISYTIKIGALKREHLFIKLIF